MGIGPSTLLLTISSARQKTLVTVSVHDVPVLLRSFGRSSTVNKAEPDALIDWRMLGPNACEVTKSLMLLSDNCCWCRHEFGEFYAIDIGGTNFRVSFAHLSEQHGEVVSCACSPVCSEPLLRTNVHGCVYVCHLTASFRQRPVDRGILLTL